MFRFDLLKLAFQRALDDGFTGTGESRLVERMEEVQVIVVQGSDRNLKITKPSDMDLARVFLAEQAVGPDRPLILGGLAIPAEFGLAERPKLKGYRLPIRERLGEILGLSLDRVSLKFKTAEKVGPVGEGRSAEAQAIVMPCKATG